MPTTSTEDLIKDIKHSRDTGGILVPLIEEFMRKPVEIEDKYDRKFLNNLIKARSQPRKKGVYSPSALSSCVRKVYFTKAGMKQVHPERISASGFFLEGNFRHFKWQFVAWKMHRAQIIELVDVGSICIGSEIYVENDRGDFGGTIDSLIYIPGPDIISTVDWKGMNGNNFYKALAANSPPLQYKVQISGYASLANSYLSLPKKIKHAIVVYENKNGAVNTRQHKSQLGLKEFQIDIQENTIEVSKRLKRLRVAERRKEVPPIECVSTRTQQFKDCPFLSYCRGEVERVERKKVRLNRITKSKDKKLNPTPIFNSRKKK